VATTDMGAIAKLAEEFESRRISVFAIGNDSSMFFLRKCSSCSCSLCMELYSC